jgi:hydrogenase maturation protein HypF
MNSRLYISIRGAVQGVGFRPFVYRIAKELKLTGYVLNSPMGVTIEVDGEKNKLDIFILRIKKEKPPRAIINSLEFSFLDTAGFTDFQIRESEQKGAFDALILPDIAVCPDCLSEMFDPANRRYLYPFINCTNCGPRFSIIESLPYDRPNTSMKKFEMCQECRSEYENPLDRRFHAQPIACEICGPHTELWDDNGNIRNTHSSTLAETIKLLKEGKIVALKGLGGFQLLCDARNDQTVRCLRERKHREEKPFALMFPAIGSVKVECHVGQLEERLLLSPESPIVLLKKRNQKSAISSLAALNNPYLGVMLPYTPLHHLLMKDLGFPIIATSGNLSEEPMCIDEKEALQRLRSIADYFLVHNRPIVRQVDDSIVRIVKNREMVLRRARGYAPLPVRITSDSDNKSVVAVGSHLKNTIAVSKGNNIFISQHIGDLSSGESYNAFTKTISDFKKLYRVEVDRIACDLHPEYLSTKYANESNLGLTKSQHHATHIVSCRAENQVTGSALGVAWDGTGYGLDGTIWGGEFFLTTDESVSHIGQFRKFLLPGGEIAIKESRRSLLGILYEVYAESIFNQKDNFLDNILSKKFSSEELKTLERMLLRKVNSPATSSVGRLFDGISSLLNVCDVSNYEGKAAMMLEFVADSNATGSYNFQIKDNKPFLIDWQPILMEIIEDLKDGIKSSNISSKFHTTLAEIILSIADKVGEKKVVLSGGCFQNVLLLEKTIDRLESKGFHVYWHQRVPPNDGGISLGQAVIALNNIKLE